jgi:predicted nucleotidyltransferase
LENEVLKTIRYFSFFDYPPNFEEIYTFLGKKATKKKVEKVLGDLERQKKIKKEKDFKKVTRYMLQVTSKDTVGEYSKKFKIQNLNLKIEKYNKRYLFSQEKLQKWRLKLYLKILSFFPQIKLIGFSGSLAMMNAEKDDDIDLFIITEKNRLFTGRIIALFWAEVLGLRKKFGKNKKSPKIFRFYPMKADLADLSEKVCLNLFFDESDLAVPDFKRNEYVAHEILQMKPIVNKDGVYERFLAANSWVFEIFPNAKENEKFKINPRIWRVKSKFKIKNFLSNFKFLTVILRFAFYILNFLAFEVESMFKGFQMFFINKHRTTEIITNTQLWFHPNDFYKRIHGLTQKKDKSTRINTDKKRKNKASQKI